MNNFDLMSDLHLECDKDPLAFVHSLQPTSDTLILAGDIIPFAHNRFKTIHKLFAEKYINILFITGNHEFYQSDIINSTKDMEIFFKTIPNITYLNENNSTTTIDGQNFLGSTGWYPDSHQVQSYKYMMNDIRYINNFEPYIYEIHNRWIDNFSTHMNQKIITISHHLPSFKCINAQYQGSNLNCMFAAELDKHIKDKEPKLWVFGHTHSDVDFKLYNTRMVCNPRGYPNEKNKLYKPLLITL